jgi:hypothetical protein
MKKLIIMLVQVFLVCAQLQPASLSRNFCCHWLVLLLLQFYSFYEARTNLQLSDDCLTFSDDRLKTAYSKVSIVRPGRSRLLEFEKR